MAAGICHTDLRAHRGGILPTPHPVVLGHEGAGIVEQWRMGRFPFDRIIRRYPFDAIAQAFADCASGAAIKPVLEIGL